MKRKFFAAVLVLALMVGLCPTVMAAGKLSTPTDLAWGEEGYPPDTMFWRFGENSTGYVHLVIYRNDRAVYDSYGDYGGWGNDHPCNESLNWALAFEGVPMESGTYHFTVQNVTSWDHSSSNDSAVAASPKWTYTAPSAKLAAPSDPVWDFPYCIWKPGQIPKQQESTLMFYYSKTRNGEYYSVGATTGRPSNGDTARTAMDKWALQYNGAGYYKFRVINQSDDVTQIQNSDWSAYSEPYYYDGSPVDICEHRNVQEQNYKSPTCTEDGYSGDYVCMDCGEVRSYGHVIPAEGHSLRYDGYCYSCGQQIEYHGALGDSSQLSWVYSTETGKMTFTDAIPSGETVFVACYRNGRFAGVKAAAGDNPTVQVGTTSDQLRLFWLDGSQVPQCRDKSLDLEP